MTTRKGTDDTTSTALAVTVIAAAVAALLGMWWLSRQDWLVKAAVAAGLAIAGFGCWALWPRRRLPRHRVRHMRLRARLRLHPGPGHATVFELWLRWGRLAAARRARRSRPSLSFWVRLRRPAETSVMLARAHYGHALRVPVEEDVIFVAPPRTGKSGALADIIARYPGPVVATTTRGDLHALTAEARAACGPVYVFNPQHLADVPSTMRWDALAGCEDPATAIRRAHPLSAIAAFKGDGEDFWAAASTMWLQTLLHVAALRGGTMDLVHFWALQKAPQNFLKALPGAGGEAERWGALVRDQMTSSATRTTDTIRYMVASNLAFMADPLLREAVTPGPGMFSPSRFAREGGTLYLIAESRDDRPSPVAGLFAALVTEIYHEAALVAAKMPGGRLDPPMLWALDEITQTCPLPLPSLLADAGGRGVQIMPVVHGAAQLRARWGTDGARTILDTCGTKVFLPGISDPDTLAMASKLSGYTAARERGHEHESRHPVMTEDMVSRLPVRRDGTGYAFILRNGLGPVIARPRVIWHGRWHKWLTRTLAQPSRARADRPLRWLPDPVPAAPAGQALGHHYAATAHVADRTQVPSPSPAEPRGGTTAELVGAADVPPPAAPSKNGDEAGRSRRRRAWDQIGAGS